MDSVGLQAYDRGRASSKKTVPFDLIVHAAGSRFIGFRWIGETPDRAPSPKGITAPMA